MDVNAAPAGKAPPGRSRFGASTMALATALPVAACGSHVHNSAGPAAAGPRAVPRPEDMAEAHSSAPPEGGGVAGAEVEGGTRRAGPPGPAW